MKTVKGAANFEKETLEGTENRITVARGRYIETVQAYNTLVRSFPSNLTAKWIDAEIKPNLIPEFAAGSMGRGVERGVDAIMAAARNEALPPVPEKICARQSRRRFDHRRPLLCGARRKRVRFGCRT